MRIALDLDGVLASLWTAMIEHTTYGEDDFEQWSKPNYNRFMSEASRVWEEQTLEIDPVEPLLDEHTAALDQHHHVDVVTNTAGNDDAVERWLDHHDVQYNDIVRPYARGTTKPKLDYDLYVDDNPKMAGEVAVHYLRDQPWNQEVGGGPYSYARHGPSYERYDVRSPFDTDDATVVRINSLEHVITDLRRHEKW